LRDHKIRDKIERNLALIHLYDLILDFNVSPLREGASEPYCTRSIVICAKKFPTSYFFLNFRDENSEIVRKFENFLKN